MMMPSESFNDGDGITHNTKRKWANFSGNRPYVLFVGRTQLNLLSHSMCECQVFTIRRKTVRMAHNWNVHHVRVSI